MQLSLRLSAVAEMVTKGNRLVDVGCDHGYLPVYLILNKKIPKAIAADVGKGPLSRAREHISQYGLGAYIETRLCDGLQGIRPEEGDTLVLAGMGGPLMEKIMTEGRETLSGFRELILQPQSDVPHVRRFLLNNGFAIVQETIVKEDGKFYPVMKAVPEEAVSDRDGESAVWTEEELLFGRFLLREKHPVLKDFLERELRIRSEILGHLAAGKEIGKEARMRKNEVEEEKRQILAALKKYESEETDRMA